MQTPLKRPATITYTATFAIDPHAPASRRVRIRACVPDTSLSLELCAADERDAHATVKRVLESIYLRPAKEIAS